MMKRYSFLLLILIFCSSCYLFECYDCIGHGQNASDWLCYANNQVLVYQSQTNETDSFVVNKWESLPPEKYCGREGSGSFGDCAGEGQSSFHRINEDRTSPAFFIIGYYYMGEDAVERSSVISIHFDKLLFKCNNKGDINGNPSNATITLLKYYTQNNNSYQNVYHCIENSVDSTTRITEFFYHKSKGLLCYSSIENGVIKTWTLKE